MDRTEVPYASCAWDPDETVPVFPLMALSRHRLGSDGRGVTTLAAAWGCPLSCRMCLNPQCKDPKTPVRPVSPGDLYAMTRADDLYFRATLGGITFGGGEPLSHAYFIKAFRKLAGDAWRITVETSLSVFPGLLAAALQCVDEFIVDIKDMDPDIYRRYTGQEPDLAYANLESLLAAAGPERVLVRVPLIPGFNTREDVARSEKALRRMGAERLDLFTYVER
ncbi:MAG: radical SAM protein [Clostridia bacterium]|nr:radical SAM protein [Clostridia bacterium]